MTPESIIEAARSGGLNLYVEGGRLKLTAEHEPDAKLIEAIATNKAEVLALLSAGADPLEQWRTSIQSAVLVTQKAARIRRAALNFLDSDLPALAISHGWGVLQLFGVMRTDDEGLLDRRADLKGVVPFCALAPWDGTRVMRLNWTTATIQTGSGALLSQKKRALDPEQCVPFWQSDLCRAYDRNLQLAVYTR